MKYNVGDKVVDQDNLKFFFNPFWSNEKRYCEVVTEANEKYFSIYKPSSYNSALEEGLSCGANEYMVFYQETGKTKNWASSKTLLHMVKDKEEILSIIKSCGENYIQTEKESYDRDVQFAKMKLDRANKFYEESNYKNLDFLNQ